MAMGSPELPHEDENDIVRPQTNNLPMHGNTGASDDSDNENMDDGYAGYQPLAIDDDTTNDMEYVFENVDDDSNEQEFQVS